MNYSFTNIQLATSVLKAKYAIASYQEIIMNQRKKGNPCEHEISLQTQLMGLLFVASRYSYCYYTEEEEGQINALSVDQMEVIMEMINRLSGINSSVIAGFNILVPVATTCD